MCENDGVPIVIHDDTLDRTTDVGDKFRGDPRGEWGFAVADFDFDEIQTLDAGSWFVSRDEIRAHRSASAMIRASAASTTVSKVSPRLRAF